MNDPESNYAHESDMPDDVPWIGEHDSGGGYGSMRVACDGNEIKSIGLFENDIVVMWDEEDNCPCPESVRNAREFIAFEKKVEEILKGTRRALIV